MGDGLCQKKEQFDRLNGFFWEERRGGLCMHITYAINIIKEHKKRDEGRDKQSKKGKRSIR